MHIVTKMLIVFCAVLCVLLAALTMAYAANANILRVSIRTEQNARVAAQTEAATQITQDSQRMIEKQAELDAMKKSNQDRVVEITGLQAERTELRSRLQQAQSDADSIRNQISQIGATVDTQAKLITNYRDEVITLRQANMTGTKHEVELLDKINDLTSQREVLEQTARALKEQLTEVKLTLQAAQQGGAGQGTVGGAVTNMGAKTQPRELPGPLVRGEVTETFKSPAGDDMVVINQGSNRGLKEGILMNVTRGDSQFVASIVLTTVEPTRAVGRIVLSKSAVQTGDVVLSRLDN